VGRSEKKLKSLTSIEKRDLLASDRLTREDCLAYAEDYFEHEMYDDAIGFYAKAEDAAGLAKVKRAAIELGNAALMFRLASCKHAEIRPGDWEDVGDAAMQAGRFAYAVLAYKKSGDAAKLAQAAQHYTPPESPFRSQEKDARS